MGRKLILGDGTELPGAEAGFASGVLWLYNLGTSIPQVVGMLNETRTQSITFVYGGMEDTYEGFTVITAVQIEFDGTVKVALKQDTGNN